MAIPQTFIQELLSRADVVDIVGRYVQLKKGGANFLGLCPFHAEKSPSFTVSPSKQFYHCFGCGKNGNAIGFLMDYAGMNFVEAVKDLAGQYGMQVPEDDRSPGDRARAAEERQKQATLTDVLEKACTAYKKQLRSSTKAIEYFKGRGVTGEIAKQFGLGYAPEGWRSLASVFPEYDDPLLAESGLVIVNEDDPESSSGRAQRYDRFRDRVMFPIRNVKGECIGFGGRVLGEGTPKYLNSPETPVFSKGRELYGLFEARNAVREHGYVLVTEGYMDVVALAQLGFPNAVATLGTACTTDHVHKLFRFTDSVVFSFDGDAAGRRAARKALDGALPYATDVRSVKFLFLPPEHDPDSYIREHGRDAFARYVADAAPLSRFLVEVAREGCDLSASEGRARLAANARPLWGLLPEGALKRQILNELAELVQEDPRDLHRAWAGSDAAPTARKKQPAPQWTRRFATRPSIEANGRNVARILLAQSKLWEDLTHAEHEVLCGIEGGLGAMFRWLDGQTHDHGPQPLAALEVALAGEEFEPLARELLALENMQPTGRVVDTAEPTIAELRPLALALRLDALDLALKQLQGSDAPDRVQREHELILEQFQLKRELHLLKSQEKHIM